MNDDSYIKLTLELAAKGKGRVSPNPLVGCVIVKDNKIIGAGCHEYYGGNHAEVNALLSASDDVSGATLYVNLEPCSHFGKTPPCADAIISSGIKKVVVGTLDNNPLVSGNGVRKLLSAGIDVKVGVRENECLELNRFFFKYIQKQIPYVTLKIAQTIDGKIADSRMQSKWITSRQSRLEVHLFRARYDAVMIGRNTVEQDDPHLTVRMTEGRNPKRVILDSSLNISLNKHIFKVNPEKNIVLITSKKSKKKVRKLHELEKRGVKVLFCETYSDGNIDLSKALRLLGKEKISSLLVEGGSRLFTNFLRDKLADEIRMFIAPKLLGKGLPAIGDLGISNLSRAQKWRFNKIERFGDDVMFDLRKG